jgi:hypothetical protein
MMVQCRGDPDDWLFHADQTRHTIAFCIMIITRVRQWSTQGGTSQLPLTRRRLILRNFIDNAEAGRLIADKKLTQRHFTPNDINYAALYAKTRTHKWLQEYQRVWATCKLDLKFMAYLKTARIPHISTVLDDGWNHGIVDLNLIPDDEILHLPWPHPDRSVPYSDVDVFSCETPRGGPIRSFEKSWVEVTGILYKHWTRSIERWAINAQRIHRHAMELQSKYESFLPSVV